MKTRNFVLLALVMVFAVGCLQAKPWNPRKRMGLEILYSAGYDGNMLEMSDYDIDRFENNELPGSTAPGTYDAMMQEFGLKFNITSPRLIGKNRTRFYYTVKYLSFGGNRFNDRISHSFFLTQDVMKGVDLVGSYFLIPNRYLRDYFDKDVGVIRATEFAYNLYTAGVRWSVTKPLRIDIRYEGYQVYYNNYFTEYDTESHGMRADVRYKLTPTVTLNGAFKLRFADNVGFDESSAIVAADPLLDAEYGDGSYGEEYFEYGFAWKSPKMLNREWDISLKHRIRHRYYTSDFSLEDDPFHAGREHLHQRVMFTMETEIVPGLEGGPSIDYEWRRSDSPNDRVPEVKDFDVFRFSFKFSYKVW